MLNLGSLKVFCVVSKMTTTKDNEKVVSDGGSNRVHPRKRKKSQSRFFILCERSFSQVF